VRNLSMTEIGFIILIGLLVLGPKRIPEIARNIGKAWRVFQEETKKAQGVFKEAFDEVDAAARELKTAADVGVIDRPDGAPAPPKPPAQASAPRPEPTPELIEQAASVEPAPDRLYEDT
jgi:TatA/E family protein of Tat protein translocase